MDWISVRSLPPLDIARQTARSFWRAFEKRCFEDAIEVCHEPVQWFGRSFAAGPWIALMKSHHPEGGLKTKLLHQLDGTQLRHIPPHNMLYYFGGVIRRDEVVLLYSVEKKARTMSAALIVAPSQERIRRFVDAERFRLVHSPSSASGGGGGAR